MFVFVCAGCGVELTAALSEVALPAHAHQQFGNGLQLPVLMEPGTFAVEPEPWGPPWRTWNEVRPEEAAARGIHAPVDVVSDGAPGAIVVAPGDTRNTVLMPDRRGGACCGLAGADGPNLACEACGLPVASRIDDCSAWQAVWLAPDAVRRLTVDVSDATPLTWAELMAQGRGTPPFEPITAWGSPPGSDLSWSWSPQWTAAAGRALAHLLVASQGRPVTVPNGPAQEVFQRTLDALLPAGPPARRAILAGPGLPAPDPDADILLVPNHPQTGRNWTPEDPAGTAYPVPLAFGVWFRLVFPEPHLPLPTSGPLAGGVMRDDPPPPRPSHAFQVDWQVFRRTLARLPAVRSPWLRDSVQGVTHHECGHGL